MINVLIVDDADTNIVADTAMLQRQGFRLAKAAKNCEVVAEAAARSPDVILLNVALQGVSGIEACRRLKADRDLSSIPVVLFTAYDDPTLTAIGVDAGANQCITLPTTAEFLSQQLKSALSCNVRRLSQAQNGFSANEAHAAPMPRRRSAALIAVHERRSRSEVARWLADEGFQCHEVDDLKSARDRLSVGDVDLAVVDFDWPADATNELLDFMAARYGDTACVALAPATDVCTAIFATRRGVCGYMVTPIEREPFLMQVRRAIAQRRSTIERRRYTRQLEDQVRQQTFAIRLAHEEIIQRLVSASSSRDIETDGHVRRVGLLSGIVARAAGWRENDIDFIRLAAPMHDVGKVGIPDSILRKPSRLTPEEFETMKLHSTIGANMLAGSEFPLLRMAREIALSHHERFDGTGYPAGLAGEAIPESARIVAIVDAYDSLTHRRVYRPAMTEDAALCILSDGRGMEFDPRLLDLFFEHLDEVREISRMHPDEAMFDEHLSPVAVS